MIYKIYDVIIYEIDYVIVTENYVIILFSNTWPIQRFAISLFFTADISHL